MKNKYNYKLAVFIVMCILLNYGGRLLSDHFELPVWLDCFGTALTSYSLGPVCGAIVGVTHNIIYGFSNYLSFVYSLTSVVIAVVIGLCAKRKSFDTVFISSSSQPRALLM